VVHDAPVGLFGHPHVETAVTGFHVKDRNFPALGGDYRQAAVGIPQHQHGLGLHLGQHLVHPNDEIADGVRRAGGIGCTVEEVVGFAHPQVVKENLVQLVIVVLAGVHQHMLAMRIQLG
jgi:hypothetical protein